MGVRAEKDQETENQTVGIRIIFMMRGSHPDSTPIPAAPQADHPEDPYLEFPGYLSGI